MKNLAIVIPAYKATYLDKALKSIANQTCKKFTLYIGDDASPKELYHIIEKYETQINLVYKRFDTNLGGANLVKQWHRCIDLIEQEEWIWLFSDDDEMELNCVQAFYDSLDEEKEIDLFHFNTDVINAQSKNIKKRKKKDYPQRITCAKYLDMRYKMIDNTYVVNFIFKRSTFEKVGGFKYYDLAWNSDRATWLQISKEKGIYTIPKAKVKWRYSGENISSITEDKSIVLRKLEASLNFSSWSHEFLEHNSIQEITSSIFKIVFVLRYLRNKTILSQKEKNNHLKRYFDCFGMNNPMVIKLFLRVLR